jgi:GNAT superfamily N-acetyltransferase
MNLPLYRIRFARQHDLPSVLRLRRHAESWLGSSGITQWTSEETGNRIIAKWISEGGTYVLEDQVQDIIGTLTLGAGDPDFWRPEELRMPALYLYKFILRSDHRGNGLGELLLDWACQQTELRWGLWLRLDCRVDNAKLHDYYLRRGFRHLATRPALHRESGALFERIAELRTVHTPNVKLLDDTASGTAFLPERLRSPLAAVGQLIEPEDSWSRRGTTQPVKQASGKRRRS